MKDKLSEANGNDLMIQYFIIISGANLLNFLKDKQIFNLVKKIICWREE
ncbi:MAG: hypothetical protein SAJ37_16640 [Oscillatoria sp. PMC 1068.18]|nr:hypothetical protein [Oscillatoria sp. PMC 1076.18]MEC4990361.1 hypothetical protein [Oscillatoria sp. PMC 1068.18]